MCCFYIKMHTHSRLWYVYVRARILELGHTSLDGLGVPCGMLGVKVCVPSCVPYCVVVYRSTPLRTEGGTIHYATVMLDGRRNGDQTSRLVGWLAGYVATPAI